MTNKEAIKLLADIQSIKMRTPNIYYEPHLIQSSKDTDIYKLNQSHSEYNSFYEELIWAW